MDFEQARFNMIEQQIRPWDVLDPDVLNALRAVKRELFVLPEHQVLAFSDVELPIGCGQSMLEPKIEAKALQAIGVKTGDSILEIGAGSGYMAALLAARGEWVRPAGAGRPSCDGLVRTKEILECSTSPWSVSSPTPS